MLERLANLPAGIDGLKALGKLSRVDYDAAFRPLLDAARQDGRKIKLLYELGPEFEGITSGAAWEEVRLGLPLLRLFAGCALVSDHALARDVTRLMGLLMPCPLRIFHCADRESAVAWLASLREPDSRISHRLLSALGVMVVEVKAAPLPSDLDDLKLTADAWIHASGELHALVIHAREFPGWDTFTGLLDHLHFARGHHLELGRIALATDTRLATWAPKLDQHFAQAEIKHFPYENLTRAIQWAAEREP
jgi:SpoIIAA-like